MPIAILIIWWCIKQKQKRLDKWDRWQKILDAFAKDQKRSPACYASLSLALGGELNPLEDPLLVSAIGCQCFKCREDRKQWVTEESSVLAELMQAHMLKRFETELVDMMNVVEFMRDPEIKDRLTRDHSMSRSIQWILKTREDVRLGRTQGYIPWD